MEFSVIIPVFNREAAIEEAVRSAQEQTVKDIEIVVVNDASTDGTANILRALARDDRRIRVKTLSVKRGLSVARNIAASTANGKYLAYLGSDDVALPHRLEAQGEFFRNHPGIAAVGSSVEWFGAESRIVTPVLDSGAVAACMMFSLELFMPSVTIRKSVYDRLGLSFDPTHEGREDWEMFLRLIRHADVANIPDVLVRYRRWEQKTSSANVDTVHCAAMRIRSRQLEWFGIPRAQHDLAAHLVASRCHWPLQLNLEGTVVDMPRVEAWLAKLSRVKHERVKPESVEFAVNRARECAERRLNGGQAQSIFDKGDV